MSNLAMSSSTSDSLEAGSASSADPRKRIDRYEVLGVLGRGATGTVYRALDEKLDREVAVKLLDSKIATTNPKHVHRFEREARAIASLHHPNIVELYDIGRAADDQLFLVMELVGGSDTGALLRNSGPMPESVAASIAYELCRALAAAHTAGVIHRDIKPENVFVDHGRVVLGDFGIVKSISETGALNELDRPVQTEIVGTPGFMAPEQIQQLALDGRADIFALGALLYSLTTDELPYSARSPYALLTQFRQTRPPLACEHNAALSLSFSHLLRDCLEVNREHRPNTIEDVRERLRGILDEQGVVYPRELIAVYQRAPKKFPVLDRERRIQVLIKKLKIAVYEGNTERTQELRCALDGLESNWSRVRTKRTTTQKRDEDGLDLKELERRSRRLRSYPVWAACAVGLIASVSFIAWNSRGELETAAPPPSAPVESKETPAMGTLKVHADQPTRVVVDGRPRCISPDCPTMPLSPGPHAVQFLHESARDIVHSVEVRPAERISVEVRWEDRSLEMTVSRMENEQVGQRP